MSFRAAVGLSRAFDPELAVREAAGAALERLGTPAAGAALLFASSDHKPHLPALLAGVRRVAGAPACVGCTALGCLTLAAEIERQTAFACLLLAADAVVARPFLIPELRAPGRPLGKAVAESVVGHLGKANLVVVLPDPRGFAPAPLFSGLEEAVGFLPVVGGIASSAPPETSIFEFAGDAAEQRALAGLHFAGDFAAEIGVAQGCRPIGRPYAITKAQGNVVLAAGGRPPLAVLREAVEDPALEAEMRQGQGLFAGIAIDPNVHPLQRGDFVVRSLIGYDEGTGALALNEGVRVGQTLQFHVRSPAAARQDLQHTVARVKTRLAGRTPVFGLYFNCVARGAALYGVPDHDVGIIRAGLGDFPLAGFFGNGELAPLGRRNLLHNFTGVLAVVTAAAPVA